MKKALAAIALGISLLPKPALADEITVQPEANENGTNIRVYGKFDTSPKGYLDFLSDFQNGKSFPAVRYTHDLSDELGDGAHATAECLGATGVPGTTRLGLGWNTSLWDGNFTLIRAFPFSLGNGGKQDPMLFGYFRQDLGSLDASLLLRHSMGGESSFGTQRIYYEAGLHTKLENLTLSVENRGFFNGTNSLFLGAGYEIEF